MHASVWGIAHPGRAGPSPGARLVEQIEGDLSLQAFQPAGQLGPRQPPGRAAVERLGHPGQAGVGADVRFQHVAVVAVAPLHLLNVAGLEHKTTAGRGIEQAVEQGRCVHARGAPPVDAAIRRDERTGAPIANGGVGVDGRIPFRVALGRHAIGIAGASGHGSSMPPVAPITSPVM